MPLYYFYINYITYDFSQKFSVKSSYTYLVAQNNLVVNVSDSFQKFFPFRFVPIFFFMFSIFGSIPSVTRIKKPVSSFRTIRGDLIGCKITIFGKNFFKFFSFFFHVIYPFVKRIGYRNSFNLNRFGVGTFGLQNLKTFETFSNSSLRFISYDIGCDFSVNHFSLNRNDILSKFFFFRLFNTCNVRRNLLYLIYINLVRR